MRLFPILLLLVTIFLSGCETLKPKPDPMPPTCPAPPKLPPLPAFDRKLLEGSFLEELGSGMFEPTTGPTSYELLPSPATGSTKTPRLRSNQ